MKPLSRRSVTTGLVAAVTAIPVDVKVAAGEDAELIRLWSEWLDQADRTLAAQDAADAAEKTVKAEIAALPEGWRPDGIGWSGWRDRVWPTVFEARSENGRVVERRKIPLKKYSRPLKPARFLSDEEEDAARRLSRRRHAPRVSDRTKQERAIKAKHESDALDLAARGEWEKLAAISENIRSIPAKNPADHAIKAAAQAVRACPNMTDWVGVIIAGASTHALRETLEARA
jgi:hypothetical protein